MYKPLVLADFADMVTVAAAAGGLGVEHYCNTAGFVQCIAVDIADSYTLAAAGPGDLQVAGAETVVVVAIVVARNQHTDYWVAAAGQSLTETADKRAANSSVAVAAVENRYYFDYSSPTMGKLNPWH